VLLAIAGIASVYAYDAHLDSQSTELEITFVPFLPEATRPEPPRTASRAPANSGRPVTQPERIQLIDSPSNPNNPPREIGTMAQPIPPAPPGAVLSDRNVDPDVAPGGRVGVPGGTGNNTPVVDIEAPPPPPAPQPTPIKILKISRILNSQAISLPKPVYPRMATQIRLQGMVTVQVLIDETGKVISAKALSGHPILVPEAQRAAMQARFSPTIIGETPVKVSGVITYNFVMP
jgi:TonB family protein